MSASTVEAVVTPASVLSDLEHPGRRFQRGGHWNLFSVKEDRLWSRRDTPYIDERKNILNLLSDLGL